MDKYTDSLIEASVRAIKDGVKEKRTIPVPDEGPIEAYGVKGMKSIQWRKTFKNADALNKWLETNDAEMLGMRIVEKSK